MADSTDSTGSVASPDSPGSTGTTDPGSPAAAVKTGGPGGRSVVLVAMTLANAMVLVDQTAVPLILPSVIRQFGIGSQLAQWVINASLLPLAGLLIFGGRLSDVIGRRRTFLIGSVLFAGASACAGLAPNFAILLVFRVFQGAGGALMLPTTIAIVSEEYAGKERGRALGAMGGAAAVAGAFGPVIGGTMTSVLGWRSVLLINVPLAAVAVIVARRSVPADGPRVRQPLNLFGTFLLSVALIGFVLGLSQSQDWGWASPGVYLPLAASVVCGVLFVYLERGNPAPLLNFSLLRRHPNYLAATGSQALSGMVEMGVGVLFPLLLILNLGMPPGVAGLALIPTTIPMIAIAPLAGRWYDRSGGRSPLLVGFAVLALSGVALGLGVHLRSYWAIFPGFLLLGIGLALILTVNDPVTLDTLDETNHGEASGVSATAEQFGGALGISVLYLIFHVVYVSKLRANVNASPLADLTGAQSIQLRNDIVAAEQTGLNPRSFDPRFVDYLQVTLNASQWGFSIACLAVTVLAVLGGLLVRRVVKPAPDAA